MKNLQNNKRYKIANSINLLIAFLSLVVALLRVVLPNAANKVFFLSSYIAWYIFNSKYKEYQNLGLNHLLLIATMVLIGFVLIHIACWILARKRIAFMICAVAYLSIDLFLFAADMVFYDQIYLLILGGAFKMLLIISMLIGLYYGFIGRRIEEDEENAPNAKFFNTTNYNEELAKNTRKIIIKREKSLLNDYIYLQCYLDNNHNCYLKNGDMQEITIDGNAHKITIVAHFERVKPRKIKIPEGNENKTYVFSIKRKKFIFKLIEINEE
ncbi:MAG: hypothetical protein J6A95_02145 [Clostridia bacterium]|nr:hypothetical protein [Clostridia bacterium]